MVFYYKYEDAVGRAEINRTDVWVDLSVFSHVWAEFVFNTENDRVTYHGLSVGSNHNFGTSGLDAIDGFEVRDEGLIEVITYMAKRHLEEVATARLEANG